MKWLAAILITATFNTSTTAVVSWQQPAGVGRACLMQYHQGAEYPAGICWENPEAGTMIVRLPGTLTHSAYKPQMHDRFVLFFDGDVVGETYLGGPPPRRVYRTYLPLTQHSAPLERAVYLPWLGID